MNSHGKGSDRSAALYQALLTLKTPDECYAFFEDLCTVSEQMAMEQRFEVARLLDQGDNYSDVLEKTGVSTRTVSRVKRLPQLRRRRLSPGAGPDERRGAGMSSYGAIGGLVRQSHRGRGL